MSSNVLVVQKWEDLFFHPIGKFILGNIFEEPNKKEIQIRLKLFSKELLIRYPEGILKKDPMFFSLPIKDAKELFEILHKELKNIFKEIKNYKDFIFEEIDLSNNPNKIVCFIKRVDKYNILYYYSITLNSENDLYDFLKYSESIKNKEIIEEDNI